MPFAALFILHRYHFDIVIRGYIVIGFSIAYLGGNLVGGYFGDKVNSLFLIKLFAFLLFVSMLVGFVLQDGFLSLIGYTISSFAAGAVNPVVTSYAISIVPKQDREEVFSNLYRIYNLAIGFVYIVGGFLVDRNIEITVLLFTIISSLCFILSIVPFKSNSHLSSQSIVSNDGIKIPGIAYASFAVFFFLAILDAQRSYQLPVWLDSINSKLSSREFGVIGIINAAIVLFASKRIIIIMKRFEPLTNMALSGVLYSIGFGSLFFVSSFFAACIGTVVWTFGEILGATYMNILLAEHAPEKIRARIFSVIPLLLTGGRIVSIELTSVLTRLFGIDKSWLISPILGALVLGGVVIFRRMKKQRASR
jgi:MFS family permease